MGGRVMSDIIKKGKEVFLSAQQAIFQPQSEFGLVRHALEDIGMVIDRESICREGNKYYRALSAIANKDSDYAGNNFFPYNNEFMYEYGRILLDEKNELLISYLKKRYERTGKIKEKIESTGVVQTVDNDNDVELQLVTDALKYMNLL
jgi:tRNA (adenine22-N1)-methyltransferase